MKSLFTSHKLIVVLFTALFTLTLHNMSTAQTHIHVDAAKGVNAATGRGAAAAPYKSITYALVISEKSDLPAPWHVHIHPGTYDAAPAKPANEREVFPIRLRSKMVIQGTTTATDCILDAQHLGETETPILLGEDVGEVSIRNLTVQNMNRTGTSTDGGGIVFWDTGGRREAASSIETCIIHNNAPNGVATNLSLTLTGNTFSNNSLQGVWTNTSLTVLKNTFSDHVTGLWIEGDSTGYISDNTFQNNVSHHNAGGIHVTGTLNGNITHNTFTNNHGDNVGGGFVVQNGLNGNVTHNTFTGNIGKGGNSAGGFTTILMTGNITHNTFTDNTGGQGGGFLVQHFTGNITHNEFIRNTARSSGSGGGFRANSGKVSSVTHNLFDSNSNSAPSHAPGGGAGAVLLYNNRVISEFTNNIFFNNTASRGVSSVSVDDDNDDAPARFTNNLFMVADGLSAAASIPAVFVNIPGSRFHNNIFSGMKTAISIGGDLDLPITHNLFHNIGMDFVNSVGNDLAFWELLADGANNNITGDPLLVDAANGDFHPIAGSPTIDAGTNTYAPADDFEGAARPAGAAVDIGPYEYGATKRPTTVADVPTDVPETETPTITTDVPETETPTTAATVNISPTSVASTAVGEQMEFSLNITKSETVSGYQATLQFDTTALRYVSSANGDYLPAGAFFVEPVVEGDLIKLNAVSLAGESKGDGTLATFTFEVIAVKASTLTLSDVLLTNTAGETSVPKVENAEITEPTADVPETTAATVNISPASVASAAVGKQIDFSLNITGGEAVAGYQATVQFDTTALRYVSSANGDYLPAGAFFVDPVVEGNLIKLNAISLAGESKGDGTLATFTFEVIAAKASTLTLSDVLLTSSAGKAFLPTVENAEITEPTGLKGDVNGDGVVNVQDLALVAGQLGQTGTNRADVNGDGVVNVQDLAIVAGALGTTATAPALYPQVLQMFTAAEVKQWLSTAQQLDLTDTTAQRGILFLQQLLAALTPRETALLPNYPNPFNPETWIPYRLAKPADVRIAIHAADGQLVRVLVLGNQPAGMYQSRSRAAYWDGKNEVGEPVASGVYFYTLTAGDFTATRKMLIRK
ncbi:MAG: cohesin domain-containing protein [Candidatus Poribacteria bacterium]|nr:cohesin domain-containing protein [Candidatus Poribacteria bacterium]